MDDRHSERKHMENTIGSKTKMSRCLKKINIRLYLFNRKMHNIVLGFTTCSLLYIGCNVF